ncbi:MAG: mechanosensitive ion channel domain-containing protein, partial [Acidobacteriota bacterium]
MPDALARELSILWQTIDGTKLLAALLVLVVGLGIAVAMARVCDRHLRRFFPRSSPASRALIARTLRLIVIALSVLMALQILGISITSLLAAGTVIFVGIGLAIQQILQSLIAGTLLLLEREIEPGDVIRYAGEEYKVSRIGLRTTQMESRFAETLILPNYLLATAPVMNLTHRETTVVARLTVQVAYGADSDVVE